MAEIWERQKDESNKAYHTFCIYRDLGPDRSLEKTREILGKSAGYTRWMQTWSSKYDWVTRAQAYDDYIEGKKRKKNEKEILEMAERHVKVAKAFLLIIAQALQQIDPGYVGQIKVTLYNMGSEPYHIRAGDKIAQLVILPTWVGDMREVNTIEELGESERGSNGFGSTGR